jgi:hypothetical protein
VARVQSDLLANADRPDRKAPLARPARPDRRARRVTPARHRQFASSLARIPFAAKITKSWLVLFARTVRPMEGSARCPARQQQVCVYVGDCRRTSGVPSCLPKRSCLALQSFWGRAISYRWTKTKALAGGRGIARHLDYSDCAARRTSWRSARAHAGGRAAWTQYLWSTRPSDVTSGLIQACDQSCLHWVFAREYDRDGRGQCFDGEGRARPDRAPAGGSSRYRKATGPVSTPAFQTHRAPNPG